MKKVSIIIPVYNEKEALPLVIERVRAVDFGLDKEIIIVDDCSTDGTKDVYQDLNYHVIVHDKNCGKGAAVRSGIKIATGDIILIQDADLEYNPIDYIPLVNLIKEDKFDVVYGSRLLDKRNNKNFLFLSFVANKILTFITRIIFNINITDMETCYKAFRADVIKDIEIESNKFDLEPEITAKILKKNVRYGECPISYNARTSNEGKKISWKDGVAALYAIFKYRYFK